MLPQTSSSDLLQLITAAVTPVAMVSVAAVLILGINSKHQSISDRIRNLSGEFRQPATPEARKVVIARQMIWFRRRVFYAATAQRLLYLSIGAFLLTALLIVVSRAGLFWTPAAYGLFLIGVLMILLAVAYEFLELVLASRTVELEMSDVL